MKRVFSLLFIASLAISACADKEKIQKENNETANCFIKFDYNYDQLLTKSDIQKHVKIDESTYNMENSPTKGEYGSTHYEWKSDRPEIPMEILGQTFMKPDKNFVEITRLDFYEESDLKLYKQESAIDLFDQGYKKLSQAEYDKLVANLEKEFADNPAALEQAKGFLKTRMNFKHQPVENLGDRAYYLWDELYGIQLIVLINSTQFTIKSKTTANANTSLDNAIKFAREVIAKCSN